MATTYWVEEFTMGLVVVIMGNALVAAAFPLAMLCGLIGGVMCALGFRDWYGTLGR